ncbi:hypothetical protein L208DRAFT_1379274 [Tricholoma matsutake]|nr:hypothetical protein L208DRAFT_1379274 [Tricholoma matsutake 945]
MYAEICSPALPSTHSSVLVVATSEVRASMPKLRDDLNEPAASCKSDKQIFQENERKDIMPPQIKKWLQQPIECVHVLLDVKGKTMSHTYVEVGDAVVAGQILRGEGSGFDESASNRVNATLSMSGCSLMACLVMLPYPVMKLMTPGGKPASWTSVAIQMAVKGVNSED